MKLISEPKVKGHPGFLSRLRNVWNPVDTVPLTELIDSERTKELEKAVAERTKELEQAIKELAFQNDEKGKRAAELLIANSELVFQNEEKEKRAAELLLANAELEAFSYVSSHDLQEPLRKIVTFSNRILETEAQHLSKEGKEYFSRIQAAATRMRLLIDDLLAFSRLKNAEERKFESSDFRKIIEEVKADLKESIEEKGATIEVTEICEAHIIPFQFRQVMYNLLSNALKFSKPERPPFISIKSKIVNGSDFNNGKLLPEKDYCCISVSDNGIGFDLIHKDRIFEVFRRLHGNHEYAGTGIGLAIVKKVIDNHNGIIDVTSDPELGTTFHIYIPA